MQTVPLIPGNRTEQFNHNNLAVEINLIAIVTPDNLTINQGNIALWSSIDKNNHFWTDQLLSNALH